MTWKISATPWKVLRSEKIMTSPWFSVRTETCQTSEGVLIDPYYVAELPDWVHLVAFNEKEELLVVRQYRHGIQRFCIELPGGIIEAAQSPEDAARRELLEETGYQAPTLQPLPSIYADTARYTNCVYSFIASDIKKVASQKLDPNEQIEFTFCRFLRSKQKFK